MDDSVFKDQSGVYYDPKNPANPKDLQNQQLFLRIAARTVPDFASTLFEATIPLIVERLKNHGSVPAPNSPDYNDYYSGYYGAIRAWARRYHIETSWVVREAYSIVLLRVTNAKTGIDPLDHFGTWRSHTRVKQSYRSFRLPAWDPRGELPKAYIVRADQEWRKVRDEYIRTTKAELAAAGWKRMPIPRKKRLTKELRFTWAVLHQCSGKSVDQMADQFGEDTEAIRISVSRVLKDLGFESPT